MDFNNKTLSYQLVSKLLTALFVCTAFFNAHAHAAWQLNNDLSNVSFVSVKKDTIGEVHTFKKVASSISESGTLSLTIPLDEVDTAIPIRDERMRELLFETHMFPEVTLSANIGRELTQLEKGGVKSMSTTAQLTLHGVSQLLKVKVLATRTQDNALFITSQQPMIINPEEFGLVEGIERLRKIAGLPSITRSVPVTFALVYQQ